MNSLWDQLTQKLISQAKNQGIPLTGQFELTSRCNLHCRMCYVNQDMKAAEVMARERTAKEWIGLAEEARDAGMLHLLLTGGEVFIRPDFEEIFKALNSMGLSIMIYTNATMITPNIAAWLGRNPPSKVSVSLYGASPETYASVCGCADGYARAVQGIDLLLSQGINLDVKTTVIKKNVHDYDKIAEFAEKRGIPMGIVNYVFPRREGCGFPIEEERLSPKEIAEFEDYVTRMNIAKMSKSKVMLGAEENSPSGESADPVPVKAELDHSTGSFECSAGRSSFWITWDGRMTPCGIMDHVVAYPFETGLVSAWQEIRDICASVPAYPMCKECTLKPYCMVCPARTKIETGAFDRKPHYLCELARMRKTLHAV